MINKKILFFLVIGIFSLININAAIEISVGEGNLLRPNVPSVIINPPRINLNVTESNNSIFWDGNAWSDTRWLNIDGSNANQDVDIGIYDFYANNLFLNGNLEGLGIASFVNTTFLIDGNIADGDATLLIEADSSHNACINLTEGNDIGFSMCYDGVGLNRVMVITNTLTGYEYMWIDRTTGLIHLNNNTIVTGNLTADYFIGSGAELTDLNVTGLLNVTGDFTGFEINISFLSGAEGIGRMDLRGDPWWLGGVDFQIAENLIVDGNVTATNFFGNFEGNTSVWSRAGTNTFLTNVGDRVGIGTNDPDVLLHLFASDSDNAKIRLGTTVGYNIWRDNSDGFLKFQGDQSSFTGYSFLNDDGSVDLTILDSGNVGIGTSSPATTLHVDNPSPFTPNVLTGEDTILIEGGTSAGSGNFGGSIGFTRIATNKRLTAIATVQTGADADEMGLAFFTHPDTGNQDMVEVMRLDGGSVGIGTTKPQNTLNVIGDFNQSNGNSTFNMIYGEMWNHTDIGFVVDLITVQVYENITDLTDGSQNGFTLSNSKLTAQLSGLYRVDYSISFSGSANSEIGFSVGIGGVEQDQTHSHRTLGTGGDIGNAGGTGYIFLNQGDVVTLMARDEASPVKDINIIATNLNLMRIGN